MDVFPELDIYFPESQESALIAAMQARTGGLWQWQAHSPVNRPVEDGQYFFHRDGDEIAPACALCLSRKELGHLFVPCIVPDAMGDHLSGKLSAIVDEFDKQIASPAAHVVEGVTSIGTSKHTLEDYFSAKAIGLLEHFCKSSNAGDLGTHTLDQQKWMAFLLHVYHNRTQEVSGDVFGALLKAKNWWPEKGLPRLVGEYDFAMRLLEQADKTSD